MVDGDVVFIGHSEENVDEGTLGRVVAIDGTGSGDVTKTHELWRSNEHRVGFSSPLIRDGALYVVDNSGNLSALDAKTGSERWRVSVGTVGKGLKERTRGHRRTRVPAIVPASVPALMVSG